MAGGTLAPVASPPITHPDFYGIDDLLNEEHKLVRDSVRSYVKKELSPIIEECAQNNYFPSHIVKQLGDVGCFGPQIPAEYGGGGLDYISYGLAMQELERCDSGIRSTASVQGSLVMYPIFKFGSEEQKQKFLPKLGSGEMLGCFGLTEPDHGSNPNGMNTGLAMISPSNSRHNRRAGAVKGRGGVGPVDRPHHDRTPIHASR